MMSITANSRLPNEGGGNRVSGFRLTCRRQAGPTADTRYRPKAYCLLLIAIIFLASCGKIYDQNGFDWQPDTPPSDSAYNREIQVLDLGPSNLPEGHRPVDSGDPMIFSLEKFSSINLGYKTSERWDVAFGGWGGSQISGNNGSRAGIGYGSSAIGGIVLLDSPYSKVTTVPDDNQFVVPGSYGLDRFGNSLPGYLFYTFFGNIFRPDMEEWANSNDPVKAAEGNRFLHMLYPLSEAMAEAFPGEYGRAGFKYTVQPKTMIFRTANGNYAKLEMQSQYKGTMDPKEMKRGMDTPGGYMSFRYMVIRADEKRFGFVARKPPLTVDFTAKTVTVGEEEEEEEL